MSNQVFSTYFRTVNAYADDTHWIAWNPTGINVLAGQPISIIASGTICWTGFGGDPSDCSNPITSFPYPCNITPTGHPVKGHIEYYGNYVWSAKQFAELIGYIGPVTDDNYIPAQNDPGFFEVGVNPLDLSALGLGTITICSGIMTQSGPLSLCVNDVVELSYGPGHFSDNCGYFNTIITVGVGNNLSSCPFSHYGVGSDQTGDPISLFNGDKLESVTDLTLTSASGSLNFTRSYRQSQQDIFQSMGLGWTHNHNIYLTINSGVSGTPDSLLLHLDNGGASWFVQAAPGSTVFNAAAGSTAQITLSAGVYTLIAQDKSSFVFNSTGQLTKRTWPNQEAWYYTPVGGNLSTVSDNMNPALGNTLTFTYISNPGQFNHNQLYRVTDQTGRYVQFTYIQSALNGISSGSQALLSAVRDVLGNTWTYRYYGQAVGETDSHRQNFMVEHRSPPIDMTGSGIASQSISLEKLNYTVMTAGTVTTITGITQQLGNGALVTNLAFQPNGQPITTEQIAGKTTVHSFNHGIYLGSQDPAGNTTFQGRDGQLRPNLMTDARGHQTQLQWSGDGKHLNSMLDAFGHQTQFTYNVGGLSDGTLNTSIDAQGRKTQYSYTDTNNPRLPTQIQVFDTDGKTVLRWQKFSYDANGRTTTEQTLDPSSGLVQQEVDRSYYTSGNGNGLLWKVTQKDLVNPANTTSTTYFYDAVGRTVRTKQSATFGNCISSFSVYDAAGNVIASLCNYDPGTNADPTTVAQALALFNPAAPDKNKVTVYGYDALNRRIQTTTDAGASYAQTSLTVYDGLNRVIRSITNYVANPAIPDPYVHVRTGFKYGSNNDQNLVSDTTYNERGFVKTQVDVLGNVTLFGYDDAGRLIKTIQFASQPNYDNSYGPHGDPTLSLYAPSGAPDQDLITTSGYDAVGNLIKSTDMLGNVTLTGFDPLNRPVRTIRNASQPNYNVAADPTLSQYVVSTAADQDFISYTEYDALGHVTRTQDTLGSWTLYGYDGLGRQIKVIRSASQPNYALTTDPSLSHYVISSAPDLDVVTQTAYDSVGRVLYTMDVLGNKTWSRYDGLNRVVRTVTNASGTATDGSAHDPRSLTYSAIMQPDQDIVSSTVYDLNGYVLYTVDPLGRKTWQGYDGIGRQIRTTVNALGSGTDGSAQDPRSPNYVANTASDVDITTQTVYNAQGRVLATIDAAGNRTQYVYDALGRRLQTISNYVTGSYHAGVSDQDLISTTVYDIAGRVTSTTDPRGMQTTYTYDRAGRRLTTTQAANSGQATTSYTCYDKGGRVLRTIQNWINLSRQPSPDARDMNGNWLFVKPFQGNANDRNLITVYSLDRAGRQLSATDPMGNLTQMGYAKDGQLLSMTEPLGTVTTYRFDVLRRRTLTVQSYLGQNRNSVVLTDPTSWTWNGTTGRWTDGKGVFVHDGNSADPTDQNIIAQVSYDKGGRVLTQREPNGNLTSYAYDKLNRRVKLTDPAGHVWTTTYKLVGNGTTQTLTTDPLGQLTLQTTDRIGRLALLQYPGSAVTPAVTFSYDKLGNRLAMNEANGSTAVRKTRYSYDRARRLTKAALDVTGDGTQIQPVSYQYDAGGLRVGMTLPGLSAIQYRYNMRRQLVSLTDWTTQATSYSYDSAGRLAAMQRPSGLLSQYRYDADGRLLTLRHSASGHTLGSFAYTVDGRGNRVQVTEALPKFGSPGTITLPASDSSIYYYRGTWTASGANMMSTDASAALQVPFFGTQTTLTMGRGTDYSVFDIYVDGDLWSTADGYATTTGSQTFTISLNTDGPHVLEVRNRPDRNLGNSSNPAVYRVLFQSLTMTGQPADVRTTTYMYDRVSRLTAATSYVGLNTATPSLSTYTYTYDLAGNRLTATTAGTTTHYGYNTLNQVATVTVGAGTAVPYTYDNAGRLFSDRADTTQNYAWDAANRLLSYVSTHTASYLYNGQGQRMQQTFDGTVTQYLLDSQPGLAKVVQATTGSAVTRYLHGLLGIQQQQNPDSSWAYPVQDGLGSVRGTLNSTNVPQESRFFDPYGNVTQQTGTTAQTVFGFAGEETDSNGLVNLRARYYNPNIGQFFSLDPLEGIASLPTSMNRYSYVEDNPINAIDPSGLIDRATAIAIAADLCPLSTLSPICSAKENGALRGEVQTFGKYEQGTVIAGEVKGNEVVFDFATMERAEFTYSGVAGNTGAGITILRYTGEGDGFTYEGDIISEYSGFSGAAEIDAGVSLGILGAGGAVGKSVGVPCQSGKACLNVTYTGSYASLGVSPSVGPVGVSITGSGLYYKPSDPLIYHSYVKSDLTVDRKMLINDLVINSVIYGPVLIYPSVYETYPQHPMANPSLWTPTVNQAADLYEARRKAGCPRNYPRPGSY